MKQAHELTVVVQNIKVTVSIGVILELVSLIQSYVEDVEQFLIVPPTKQVLYSYVCIHRVSYDFPLMHSYIHTYIHTYIYVSTHVFSRKYERNNKLWLKEGSFVIPIYLSIYLSTYLSS